MKPSELPSQLFSAWESAVAFRLFADQSTPTLTVPEQIAAHVGDRILSGQMAPGARIEQELADEFSVAAARSAMPCILSVRSGDTLARRGAIVTTERGRTGRVAGDRAGCLKLESKLAAHPSPELLDMLRGGVQRLQDIQSAHGGNDYAGNHLPPLILCARHSNVRLACIPALSLQTLRYSKLGLVACPAPAFTSLAGNGRRTCSGRCGAHRH